MDGLNKRVVRVIEKIGVAKTEFAEALNVSPAVITHISSGRNKPGVDILQKILTIYPTINAEWLMLGVGEMLKTEGLNKNALLQELTEAEVKLTTNISSTQDVINGINRLIKDLEA